MNMANVEIALEIMGKGMGGIFVAIVVIMAAVMVLGKITGYGKDKEEESPAGAAGRRLPLPRSGFRLAESVE